MAQSKYSSVEQIRKAIKGTYSISLVLSDSESEDKLEWLKNANRDFLKVTPEMSRAAIEAYNSSFKENGELTDAVLNKAHESMGEAIVAHVAGRFVHNTDVRMRPLSPAYIKSKCHSKIGVLSGDLYRDILNARTIVKKIK